MSVVVANMLINSFYEDQMVFLDNVVAKALELKNDRLDSSPKVSDFAFNIWHVPSPARWEHIEFICCRFKMVQEFPFLAVASCSVSETPVDKAAEICRKNPWSILTYIM